MKEVRVDMGEPLLERGKIPMLGQKGTVVNEELKADGRSVNVVHLYPFIAYLFVFKI